MSSNEQLARARAFRAATRGDMIGYAYWLDRAEVVQRRVRAELIAERIAALSVEVER